MSKFNSLLTRRFKSGKKEKMTQLVQRSNAGQLSSFAGIFQISPISDQEKTCLKQLLTTYQTENADLSADLAELTTITSEVKAISNQAVILHGERIKKAQQILKKYRDGAFSDYLLNVYGNRQTPYNFLLYYDFYSKASKNQQKIISDMPRQVVYSLSSRKIPQEEKEAFIEAYRGETKAELLQKLRQSFPLPPQDRRKSDQARRAINLLKITTTVLENHSPSFSLKEKQEIRSLVLEIQKYAS
ncbi:MAG: CT583 family protein [Chlamydiota bacterium]